MKPDRQTTKAAAKVLPTAQQRISREEIDERLIKHEKEVFSKTHHNMVTVLEDSEWPVLPQSKHSLNTVNPIRKIADAMAVQPNPEKSLLKLHLGDPSISGKFPPPKVAVEAMKEAVESHMWDGYGPAVGAQAAREAVAKRYTHPEAPVTADDVVLASGCSHALQMAIEAVAGPGDNILVPHPGFPLYSTLCRPHGIEDRAYHIDIRNGAKIDEFELENMIDENTKAIVINNPGNPTGCVFSKNQLIRFLRIANKFKLTIIADEIYGDLVYNGAEFIPIATLCPKVPVITCDGIAKRWMVPGWRLGWLIVHNRFGALDQVKKGIIALSQKIVGPCSLVQGALPRILGETPDEYFEANRKIIETNGNIVDDTLKGVPGITSIRPQGAMYQMIAVEKTIYGDDVLFSQMLIKEESVFCLPGSAFSAPGYIRLVLANDEELMREAAERIRDFCERYASARCAQEDSSDEGCEVNSCESS